MEVVKAKCIKETYTWDGDGKQHKFPYVKNGLVYVFNVEVRTAHEKIYWLNIHHNLHLDNLKIYLILQHYYYQIIQY